ncbi:hypothetical protein V493_04866 [Pseudogymnoascus sp. VKM F-4281 (FW-2241)]|nr:hypothetical protein V493_04866 [Pseudogymnoascus sp. VKM F-4281 (FW-2241)]
MRFAGFSPLTAFVTTLSLLAGTAVADERLLTSTSLNTCIANSNFTASLFNVVFTPNNRTITFDVQGITSLTGNFTLHVEGAAYGYKIFNSDIDPCASKELAGVCHMQPGPITITSNLEFGQDVVEQIPSIAYTIPDLDATVRIKIASKANPDLIKACVEARLSNGKTVEQKGVSWATAVVAGLALVVSAVVAGLGHDNTAAHIAAYALSLFGYFQAIAMVGLTAVPLPPIVQSWTQNFQWTMGIIGVDFMQTIATWYQKSTGGTPATILNTLTTNSVQVQKRSLEIASEAASGLLRRSNNDNAMDAVSGTYTVKGMDRVAFRADMEATNLFVTGLMFFVVFVLFTVLGVAAFKGFCELAVKQKWMKVSRFEEFRNGWKVVLKGIMFRMVLIGFPQMTILCLWEFTKVDSPAEVVLAVFFFFGMGGTLAWAAFKVVMIAKRSKAMHKNPAYILYSDPTSLNKWGFLYVQFRASAYYYIIPTLVYILVKGMFIALGQGSGVAQAVGLLIIEAAFLIAASVMKPWMDKSTNTVNISICAMNFFNAICLLVFSAVFNQPAIVTGVFGVVFFVVNAIFALVLLILVIVSTILASTRKNPDTRYQPMGDDRASFIKSQTQLTTELDALGATARGEMKGGYKPGLDLDDDDSWDAESNRRHPANMPLPPSTANSHEPPRSPINPSVPLFPSGASPYDEKSRGVYQGGYSADSGPNSDATPTTPFGLGPINPSGVSPAPYNRANTASPLGHRGANGASPWQRGAGYDH